MILGDAIKEMVPPELRNRAKINLFINKSSFVDKTSLIQNWFSNRHRSIFAFLCQFKTIRQF